MGAYLCKLLGGTAPRAPPPPIPTALCFVYKVIGLTFDDRINTQLIYRFELAQVVARMITKPHRNILRFESHRLLIFYSFFYFYFRSGV